MVDYDLATTVVHSRAAFTERAFVTQLDALNSNNRSLDDIDETSVINMRYIEQLA